MEKSEQELRHIALQEACSYGRHCGLTPSEIVEAAKTFEGFLKGETAK